MRPEKLNFEDCDLNPIFKIISEKTETKTQTQESGSKDGIKSAANSSKLPLPRDLQPTPGTVKVYSYCKIIDNTDNQGKIVKESEFCEEYKVPSQDRPKQEDKKHKKQSATEKANKRSSGTSITGLLPKNKSDRPVGKDKHKKERLDKKTSCKGVCKKKYLKETSETDLGKKKSDSNKQTGESKPFSKSNDEHSSSQDHQTQADKQSLVEEIQKYLQAIEVDRSNSDSSVSSNLNRKDTSLKDIFSKRRAEARRECKRYIEKKSRVQSGEKNESEERSSEIDGADVASQGDKQVKEEKIGSKSDLANTCPRKKQSFKDFYAEQAELKEKKSSCTGLCKNKYLQREIEKYLESKKNRRSSEDSEVNSHSQSSFTSGGLKKKEEKLSKKDNSEVRVGEKSSSFTSVCTKKESCCKDICNIFSDKNLKIKCEAYIQNLFKKRLESNTADTTTSDSDYITKTQRQGSPTSRSHRKNRSDKGRRCTDVCKESTHCPSRKSPKRDYKKNVTDKCTDVCKITEACKQAKIINKDINKAAKERASRESELVAEYKKQKSQSKRSKLSNKQNRGLASPQSDKEQPSDAPSRQSKSDTESSIAGSEYKSVESGKHSKSNTETSTIGLQSTVPSKLSKTETETNTLASNTKSNTESAKSGAKTSPSQLCLYLCPCQSGKLLLTHRDCPKPTEVKKEPAENEKKLFSFPSISLPSSNNKGDSLWKKYFPTSETSKPKTEVEPPTPPQPFKTCYNMSTEHVNKLVFTNPHKPKQTNDSKMSTPDSKISYSESSTDSNNKTLPEDLVEISNDKDAGSSGREKPKEFFSIENHNKAISTIKYAMQDIATKAYSTTSKAADDAASLIQAGGARQFEKIKGYYSRQSGTQSNSDKSSTKGRKSSDVSNTTLNESNVQNLDNKVDENAEGPPMTEKILNEVKNRVESAVSFLSESMNYENMTFGNFNDQSSKYDVPDPNLRQNKAKQVENVFQSNSTSTNSMFMTIKTKILSMFTGIEKKDDTSLSSESSISTVSAPETEESELLNFSLKH